MERKLKEQLRHLELNCKHVSDKNTRKGINLLVNGVEQFVAENQKLLEENQKLKDEVSRLKGEQGKPNIRPQKKDGDISSEQERKDKLKKPKKPKKKPEIKAHQQQVCKMEKTDLPDDAKSKGYDSVIIQDIIIKPQNTEFKREVYYSPSLKKRFIASLPEGYTGRFGPGIKTMILCFYHDSGMTQPAIHRLFETTGLFISKASISRIITDEESVFHQEKQSIFVSGLRSTNYQHIDDTGARVNGKNHYTHVLCNPFYTAYFTRARKDRLTILELLNNGNLLFKINQEALELMIELGLSQKQFKRLKPLLTNQVMTKDELNKQLDTLFSNPKKHKTSRRIILEASALVVFKQKEELLKILVCDDAPQFKNLTSYLALCWIHEGRHYKKLKPFIKVHQTKIDTVITSLWDFYKELLAYKQTPCSKESERLSIEFDMLFSQKTGYDLLDDRLAKTLAKKEELLLVLKYPHIPLQNNPAELGARAQARKRDISFQTKNDKGTQAKDTMMTIVQTAVKLEVNIFNYIYDRVSLAFKMPSLTSLIELKSKTACGVTGLSNIENAVLP